MAKAISGVNDLYTWCINNSDIGNKILTEWVGVDPNGQELNMSKLGAQSNKYALWRCKNGHEWKARIQKRTLLRSGCPYCSNQRVNLGENDLETWCKNHNPQLINEFTGEDSEGNRIQMSQLSKSTHKKVAWSHIINGEEHRWVARVSDRTHKNSGCPICNSKNILKPGINDLETWCKEDEYGEIIRKQWLGIDENNDIININQIAKGSHTKVYWICDCGNIWLATPLSRLYHRNNCCDKCSIVKAQVIKRNTLLKSSMSLGDWCNNNGIKGETIKSQWVGEDETGNSINITDITYGSQAKVWWRHFKRDEEHTWLASIHNRVFNDSFCPICNTKSTSLAEQVIYRCFKNIYRDTFNRAKLFDKEFDIFIPELNLCIEYDGEYYHKDKLDKDQIKTDICNKNGVKLIRIKSSRSYSNINWDFSNGIVEGNFDNNKGTLMLMVLELFKYLNTDLSIDDYNIAYVQAFRFMKE